VFVGAVFVGAVFVGAVFVGAVFGGFDEPGVRGQVAMYRLIPRDVRTLHPPLVSFRLWFRL
jgi:hypothetical protein